MRETCKNAALSTRSLVSTTSRAHCMQKERSRTVRQCLGTAGLLSNTTTRDSHTECGWGRVSPEKCLRGMAVHVALDTTGVCVLREPPVSFLKGGAAAAREVRVYWDRK